MNSLPSISIIIPSYNQGQFIEQTICSLLDQEYPGLELIVVDGGSTDETLEIIKKYEHRLNYWVSEKDNGQTEAIIKGFKKATGDIINWLCSDDWLEQGSLLAIGKCFAQNPEWDIVHGDIKVANAAGVPFYHNRVGKINALRLAAPWIKEYMPPQPAIFYKRKLYENCRGLDMSLHFAMDYDLWFQFVEKAPFHYIPVLIGFQRFHQASKSCNANGFEKFEPEWKIVRNRYLNQAPVAFKIFIHLHFLITVILRPFNSIYKMLYQRIAIRWRITKKQLLGKF